MKVILKDKTEISIDLYAITLSEVRSLLDMKKNDHEADSILAKACGLTVEKLRELPFPDYRKITKAFWEYLSDPLKDDEEKN